MNAKIFTILKSRIGNLGILFFFCATGCHFAYQAGSPLTLEPWPLESNAGDMSIGVILNITWPENIDEEIIVEGFDKDKFAQKLVLETFQDSALFSVVTLEEQNTDLKAKVFFDSEMDEWKAADIITILSLGIIPVRWGILEFIGKIDFYNKNGEFVGEVNKTITFHVWRGWIFFWAPSLSSYEGNSMKTFIRSALIDAHLIGLI